jgi:hypothetical protein
MPNYENEQKKWEVEEVRDEGQIRSRKFYFVKWTGWPAEYNTWELEEHLNSAPIRMRTFQKVRGKKRKIRELQNVELSEKEITF